MTAGRTPEQRAAERELWRAERSIRMLRWFYRVNAVLFGATAVLAFLITFVRETLTPDVALVFVCPPLVLAGLAWVGERNMARRPLLMAFVLAGVQTIGACGLVWFDPSAGVKALLWVALLWAFVLTGAGALRRAPATLAAYPELAVAQRLLDARDPRRTTRPPSRDERRRRTVRFAVGGVVALSLAAWFVIGHDRSGERSTRTGEATEAPVGRPRLALGRPDPEATVEVRRTAALRARLAEFSAAWTASDVGELREMMRPGPPGDRLAERLARSLARRGWAGRHPALAECRDVSRSTVSKDAYFRYFLPAAGPGERPPSAALADDELLFRFRLEGERWYLIGAVLP